MSTLSGVSSSSSQSQFCGVSASNNLATVTNSSQQLNGPLANLNLTTAQLEQLQQILQNAQTGALTPAQAQSQIDAVLTPAQQAQLQADRSAGHHHHHHHAGGGPGSSGDGTDEFGIPTNLPSASNSGTFGSIAEAYAVQTQLQNKT